MRMSWHECLHHQLGALNTVKLIVNSLQCRLHWTIHVMAFDMFATWWHGIKDTHLHLNWYELSLKFFNGVTIIVHSANLYLCFNKEKISFLWVEVKFINEQKYPYQLWLWNTIYIYKKHFCGWKWKSSMNKNTLSIMIIKYKEELRQWAHYQLIGKDLTFYMLNLFKTFGFQLDNTDFQ